VYWTRRLLLVALALLLVFGIARLLSLGSDGSSAPAKAAEVAAEPTSTPSLGTTPTPTAGEPRPVRHPGRGRTSQAPVLAEPQGSCTDEDVAVSPEAKEAVAGPQGEVRIALHLRTLTSEACTWRVSHSTLALKITSGSDDIWSSRQCPGVVPVSDVVVRRAVTTTVDIEWNGRRADHGCGNRSDWALPGTYHVTAAALAGEPADEQFELEAPRPRVITVAPSPTQEPSPSTGTGRRGSSTPGATSTGH
jgi:hypothetical protein